MAKKQNLFDKLLFKTRNIFKNSFAICQAALFIEGLSHQCGATLITDQHVITAAHCVILFGVVLDSSQFMIRLGEHHIRNKTVNDAEEDYLVSKVLPHDGFNSKNWKNDIAIIKLDKKVLFI